jgi:hypothetical protein
LFVVEATQRALDFGYRTHNPATVLTTTCLSQFRTLFNERVYRKLAGRGASQFVPIEAFD